MTIRFARPSHALRAKASSWWPRRATAARPQMETRLRRRPGTGICPDAITVGALNTKGTPWRSDDEVASYSSKGPTPFDRLLKPDLVAPGNKILGLAAPGAR